MHRQGGHLSRPYADLPVATDYLRVLSLLSLKQCKHIVACDKAITIRVIQLKDHCRCTTIVRLRSMISDWEALSHRAETPTVVQRVRQTDGDPTLAWVCTFLLQLANFRTALGPLPL